jgi:uncharacterized protein (DUF433 family)
MAKARTDSEMREFLKSKSEMVAGAGCHIWLGGLDKDEYGQTHYQGKNIRAHRIAWILANGAIPNGLVVMHRCDVPTCINPHHLSLGTNQENTTDKIRKNRLRVASGDSHYMRVRPGSRAGEKSPTSKLTEQQVRSILGKCSSGESRAKIATEFNVSRTCISAIATRRIWKHLEI